MLENKELFDLSGYPHTSPFYDNTNNKVIGKMKDESPESPILEFVGLRRKMYSYQTIADAHIEEKHRVKGIQKQAAK